MHMQPYSMMVGSFIWMWWCMLWRRQTGDKQGTTKGKKKEQKKQEREREKKKGRRGVG